MRIVIDLDGTICHIKKSGQSYKDLEPMTGAIEFLRVLRKKGHYVIIQTARNMATCESNMGKVMKNVGKITLEWLENYQVEYDEIYFGKPNADIYIDDRSFRFENWADLSEEYLQSIAKDK